MEISLLAQASLFALLVVYLLCPFFLKLSPCMLLLFICLVVRLLFQFLCNFLVQGGEFFAVPLGKSSFLPLGKGSLHTMFLHVPCLVSLIHVVAHVYWFVKSRGSFGTSWPLGGVRLFFAYLMMLSSKLILS